MVIQVSPASPFKHFVPDIEVKDCLSVLICRHCGFQPARLLIRYLEPFAGHLHRRDDEWLAVQSVSAWQDNREDVDMCWRMLPRVVARLRELFR